LRLSKRAANHDPLLSPMMAGLAVQRTVERADSVPVGQIAGLGVAAAWAAAAVLAAVWLIRRRDA
jgi:ABC-2 type transport system permease protein